MAAALYVCPRTGFKVQTWIADQPSGARATGAVECPICNSTHFVNPVVGGGLSNVPANGRASAATQGKNKNRGFADNLPAQLALLAVAIVVLLIVAWRYLW